ncbi:hypothetical protein ACO2I3_08500 [Leptospira interrogans]
MMPKQNGLIALAAAMLASVATSANSQSVHLDRPAAHAKVTVRAELPHGNEIVVLIQNSIIAVNQANATNNYTVLHALAAPGFQNANPPAKLAEIFANLRSQRVDMSFSVLYMPKLTAAPTLTDRGMLRLAGFFATHPQQVQFDLLFQRIDRQWKMFGISLGAVDVTSVIPPPKSGDGTVLPRSK